MEQISRRRFVQMLGALAAASPLVRDAMRSGARAQGPDHITQTYAAFVDTHFPATPHLPHATGGVDVRAHEFLMDALDSFLPMPFDGSQTMPLKEAVVVVIDAHAAQVTPGKTFVQQTDDERLQTLALLDASPSGDARFISFALPGMAALGAYTEWPAYGKRYEGDHDSLDVSLLPMWVEIGFGGPPEGYAKLMHPYNPGNPIDPTDPSIP